jgi:hypothetical protein
MPLPAGELDAVIRNTFPAQSPPDLRSEDELPGEGKSLDRESIA